MANKTRYNDEELEEFRHVINEKLKLARRDYEAMMRTLMNADGNDVDDTSPTYKVLEEGSATQTTFNGCSPCNVKRRVEERTQTLKE